MSTCLNCHRNMNTLNIVYCSVDCRKGITKKGSGVSLDPNDMRDPPLAANVGLRRPYGNKELMA